MRPASLVLLTCLAAGVLSAEAAADAARKLYDPKGDQALEALKQQVSIDAARDEPARRLADETARSGQPTWLYRFSYVAAANTPRRRRKSAPQPGPAAYVFKLPGVGDRSGGGGGDAATDSLGTAYWVSFVATGDPNGPGRPLWPRHTPAQDDDEHADAAKADASAQQAEPPKPRPDLWRAAADDGSIPAREAASLR